MSTSVTFENVTKTFSDGKRGNFAALKNVSLTVPAGEVFGIVGYSGAGKSTLLRTVNALERPSSGRILVGELAVSELVGADLSAARLRIGMIFQQFNLLRSRTVYKNIAYPLRLAGVGERDALDRVEELLDFVGLGEKALSYPSKLSGGQKQRVGIARALANRPDVLICDEATSALDPETTEDVLALLRRVNAELGTTIILVTHEMEVVRSVCDRVAVMQQGEVVESGAVYDVFAHPQHSTTRKFVSSVMRHIPSADTLARIKLTHRGRLVQVHYQSPDDSRDPLVTQIAVRHGVGVNVVYGGIDELQSRLFGSLTLELTGDDYAVERAIADLSDTGLLSEVAYA